MARSTQAERGLTQQACADRLNVTLRYLQSIEGGHENLTVETLDRVAKALRVGVIDLFIPPVSRTVRRGRPPNRRAETD